MIRPGPASAAGVLSAEGSTNFVHPNWAGFDIPGNLSKRIAKPVIYLNDGDAAALWGHFSIFGAEGRRATSVSVIIGTGLGGGVIIEGSGFRRSVKALAVSSGMYADSLPEHSEHRRAPSSLQLRTAGRSRIGVLADRHRALVPALLPAQISLGHELGKMEISQAAKLVRGLAEKGAIRCARRSFGHRRTRWACSST